MRPRRPAFRSPSLFPPLPNPCFFFFPPPRRAQERDVQRNQQQIPFPSLRFARLSAFNLVHGPATRIWELPLKKRSGSTLCYFPSPCKRSSEEMQSLFNTPMLAWRYRGCRHLARKLFYIENKGSLGDCICPPQILSIHLLPGKAPFKIFPPPAPTFQPLLLVPSHCSVSRGGHSIDSLFLSAPLPACPPERGRGRGASG